MPGQRVEDMVYTQGTILWRGVASGYFQRWAVFPHEMNWVDTHVGPCRGCTLGTFAGGHIPFVVVKHEA
jgi:hypothetical protein